MASGSLCQSLLLECIFENNKAVQRCKFGGLVMLIITIYLDLLAIAKDLDSKYCSPDLVDDLIQRKV